MEFSYAGNGSGGGNFAQIFLRGVGQPDFIITKDPGVGVYVDNVYFARAPGSVLELLDVERVEVLRGPQGTLFGKNTIGGAVQVVTKRPTGQFGGEAQLGVGRFGRIDGNASLDFPIVDGKLAGRVSGLARTQDGFYRRLGVLGRQSQSVRRRRQPRERERHRTRGGPRVAALDAVEDASSVLFSADMVNERQEPTEYQAVALTTPANIELYQRVVGTPRGLQPYASLRPEGAVDDLCHLARLQQLGHLGHVGDAHVEGRVRSPSSRSPRIATSSCRPRAMPTRRRYDIVAPGGVDI